MEEPRLTIVSLKVLKALLEHGGELYQAEIAEKAASNQASVSRVLGTLNGYGWVESRLEEIDEQQEGRAARRYYRLTERGEAHTRDALQEVAVKGELDETDVNQWWSDYPMLNEQGPVHDYTYTVTGLEREALCDEIWEAVDYFRTSNGYEAWNRNAVSIRVRTNTLSTIRLFIKTVDEVEETFYQRRREGGEKRALSG